MACRQHLAGLDCLHEAQQRSWGGSYFLECYTLRIELPYTEEELPCLAAPVPPCLS
jgi:hypothetical protein